jgi:phosphopantothenoylcysteine decarboxylase / phosphopantothenate---cysteine ligase
MAKAFCHCFFREMLKGKKIVIGISGGIAAYKIPALVRLFVKAGADVKVVMTPDAENFVTPETISVLTKNQVFTEFFNEKLQWNNHVDLGLWGDIFIVAPTTAKTLAKMAHGLCDNLLLAAYLSARCPVFVAPAMDEDMYLHFSTSENIAKLKTNGAIIIPPGKGELASGLVGEGRMAEPEEIFKTAEQFLNPLFAGKKVLINAGPTHEAIDPVRFIGNRSSGKTGVYLAEAFALLGAETTLVLGPSNVNVNNPKIDLVRVETAEQMKTECLRVFPQSDIFIAAAAVADYRPKNPASQKIKKSADEISLDLVKNPDILFEAGKIKTGGQILVGYALETENAKENAFTKLGKKNLDLVIGNSPGEKGEGFGWDTNRIFILDKYNKITNFELLHKRELAFAIALYIHEKFTTK